MGNICCRHKRESDRLLWVMYNILLDIKEKSFLHPEGEDVKSDINNCVVCCSNKKQILSSNCGHFCVCFGCSKKILAMGRLCPICRGSWSNLVKVYD